MKSTKVNATNGAVQADGGLHCSLDAGQRELEISEQNNGADKSTYRRRALYISTNVKFSRSLKKEFEMNGFAVSIAYDALQAVALLVKFQPDLVISDLDAPSLGGLEIWKNLNKIVPNVQDIPFVFVLNVDRNESKKLGKTINIDDFIVGPVSVRKLRNIAEEHVKAAATKRDLQMETALSPKEIDVLTWLSRGKNRQDIAKLMGTTSRTVTFHIKKAQKRLMGANPIETVVKAIKLGLIST